MLPLRKPSRSSVTYFIPSSLGLSVIFSRFCKNRRIFSAEFLFALFLRAFATDNIQNRSLYFDRFRVFFVSTTFETAIIEPVAKPSIRPIGKCIVCISIENAGTAMTGLSTIPAITPLNAPYMSATAIIVLFFLFLRFCPKVCVCLQFRRRRISLLCCRKIPPFRKLPPLREYRPFRSCDFGNSFPSEK